MYDSNRGLEDRSGVKVEGEKVTLGRDAVEWSLREKKKVEMIIADYQTLWLPKAYPFSMLFHQPQPKSQHNLWLGVSSGSSVVDIGSVESKQTVFRAQGLS